VEVLVDPVAAKPLNRSTVRQLLDGHPISLGQAGDRGLLDDALFSAAGNGWRGPRPANRYRLRQRWSMIIQLGTWVIPVASPL
jgi:hypothetical protein